MTKILLVDDEPICLETTQALLLMRGYEVEAVATAEEAIQRGREFLPDVLVADRLLGGDVDGDVDGVEVAQILRETIPDLRVVVVTGYASVDLQSKMESLPNACCLCKPIPLEKLIEAFGEGVA